MKTFIDILQHRVGENPNGEGLAFLVDRHGTKDRLTYSAFEQRVKAVAAYLQHDLKLENERVLLMLKPGLDYVVSFFACLYSGNTAVPVYPPNINFMDRYMNRISAILKNADAKIILTATTFYNERKNIKLEDKHANALDWYDVTTISEDKAASWTVPNVAEDDIALLQYTSGSTGQPKGVMVSHKNLLANSAMIAAACPDQGHVVSWLPPYHDMGLIGGILQPIYSGIPVTLLSYMSFLKQPLVWLNEISGHAKVTSVAPNFAYEFCVTRTTAEQRAALDLRGWKTALNGAEPIRAKTMERFAEAFTEAQFNPKAFMPCYGLAEATLMVAAAKGEEVYHTQAVNKEEFTQDRITLATADDQVQQMVSSGYLCEGQKVVIADPEQHTTCADHTVGEIWISGDHVAQGYWQQPEETERCFNAYLKDKGEGPFLRTGDLGYRSDGQLFVTGRSKDVIIIQGRNYYPHDIELVIEQASSAIRVGNTAAFSVTEDDEEVLVVVAEISNKHKNSDFNALFTTLKKAVADAFGITLSHIQCITSGNLPKTTSGKIQHHQCKQLWLAEALKAIASTDDELPSKTTTPSVPKAQAVVSSQKQSAPQHAVRPTAKAIQTYITQQVAQLLQVAEGAVDSDTPLANYGLGSKEAVSLVGMLEEWLDCELSPTLVYNYPTIRAQATYLAHQQDSTPQSIAESTAQEQIAVIGMGMRLPNGIENGTDFWEFLAEGRDGITEKPSDRWRLAEETINKAGYIKDIFEFDGAFFQFTPREVKKMDPQHRLVLETSWKAFENSGIAPSTLAGSNTSVFLGISSNDYGQRLTNVPEELDAFLSTGNAQNMAANRLSYLFDLRGESMTVDTACSSSLVSIHQAVQSLRSKQSDLAVAGGANAALSPELTRSFELAGMLSPNAKCKTFDDDADGYVRGEGCGIVILKRLSDAIRDNDPIRAVICGSAVNQDGKSNGLTAPNGLAQQQVISKALQDAGIKANQLNYVEVHGTGTVLGDPIEVEALQTVLQQERAQEHPCWIGSVKTNIGHLEAAAGIAGFMKTVLALEQHKIPKHLHFNTPNTKIPWDTLQLKVATDMQDMPAAQGTSYAGVSSFGFGGTNAHVILKNATPTATKTQAVQQQGVFTLAAKSEAALQQMVTQYINYLTANPDTDWNALTYTSALGREHFNAFRWSTPAQDTATLLSALQAFQQQGDRTPAETAPTKKAKVAFLYTGQGSQYTGMGYALYQNNAVFREALNYCDLVLKDVLELPLLTVMFDKAHEAALHQTQYAQPALFALSYALHTFWEAQGIQPDAVMGHSVGEFAAACAAGVYTVEEGLRLVAERGRLMQSITTAGSMIIAFADATTIQDLITTDTITIAAVNTPTNTVISGEADGIADFCQVLDANTIAYKKLQTSHAFHSHLMEPILDDLEAFATGITWQTPQIPLVSNLDGKFITETLQPTYVKQHARAQVAYLSGMKTLIEEGYTVFLELGPSGTLIRMGEDCQTESTIQGFTSLARQDAHQRETLAKLYAAGVDVQWETYWKGQEQHRIALPEYAFDRTYYHFEEIKKTATKDCAYTAEWEPFSIPSTAQDHDHHIWVVVSSHAEYLDRFKAIASSHGHESICFDPNVDLKTQLEVQQESLQHATIAGVIFGADRTINTDMAIAKQIEQSSGALVQFNQLWYEVIQQELPPLWVVSCGAQQVQSTDMVDPYQTALWGLYRVLTMEQPNSIGGCIDLDPTATLDANIKQVFTLITAKVTGQQLACRDHQLYSLVLQRSQAPQHTVFACDSEATYLITGGLGALGVQLADWLVQKGAQHLLLLGRKGATTTAAKTAIQQWTAKGIQVYTMPCDITDYEQLTAVVSQVQQKALPIRGIFHVAGVLSDGMLLQQPWSAMENVYAPKVIGAKHLDMLSQTLELTHFVLFSSIAATFGAPGQGAYAMSNAFLDGLAQQRNAKQLPALSINWGPWAGTGMVAQSNQQERFEALGLVGLTAADAFAHLEQQLAADQPQCTIANIEWERFLTALPTATSPFFKAFMSASSAEPTIPLLRAQLQQVEGDKKVQRLETWLQTLVADILGVTDTKEIDIHRGLMELGMTSIMALEFSNKIQTALGIALPSTLMFEHPNIATLTQHLLDEVAALDEEKPAKPSQSITADTPSIATDDAIAVVGIGNRFPGGADTPEAFWNLLAEGRSAITAIPSDRWDETLLKDTETCTYSKAGGFLDTIYDFDAAFFGISPREAKHLDPMHRMVLETSWRALEDANIDPTSLVGTPTGVFMGAYGTDHLQLMVWAGDTDSISAHSGLGSLHSMAAGRVAYTLGLQGPSVTIDTACSSSLVAIHQASDSLRKGESTIALAGGVNLIQSPDTWISLSKANMISPDGRCKTFDEGADGYGRGEGCGVVVLKRYQDAIKDNDRIYAVIKGSATNHDGRSAGITVPNRKAQRKVMQKALQNAGVLPEAITYLEAHGTGTKLGDPIEVNAITAVYGQQRSTAEQLAIGAVKTNIGHLEGAAGVASFIKTVLALYHEQIPPHLNLTQQNSQIVIDPETITIPTQITPWAAPEADRHAAVSSFGISGTNAHLILGAVPKVACPSQERPTASPYLLTLSAKHKEALQTMVAQYTERLAGATTAAVSDICYTANTWRSSFQHRLALVADSKEELLQQLTDTADTLDTVAHHTTSKPRIAFLFAGQGSQYAGMGKTLYDSEPVFRAALDRCDALLSDTVQPGILEVMFDTTAETLIHQTKYTQPVLFSFSYALCELWKHWGITPDVVMGHSVGEIAAACVAGVVTLEDGIQLISRRGALMDSISTPGTMAAVFEAEAEIVRIIENAQLPIDIAAINGPKHTVITGAVAAIQDFLVLLQKEGIHYKALQVSHAFHSSLQEPILEELITLGARIPIQPLALPLVSNRSGSFIKQTDFTPEYWSAQARHEVRFYEGVQTLVDDGVTIFVEIGASSTLLGMARQAMEREAGSHCAWVPSLHKHHDDRLSIHKALGTLYSNGVQPDWMSYYADKSVQKTTVPVYPFQKTRCESEITKRGRKRLHAIANKEAWEEGDNTMVQNIVHFPSGEIGVSHDIKSTDLGYLHDHQLHQMVVVPGAYYVSMILAAATKIVDTETLRLQNLTFVQPLVIGQQENHTVNVCFKTSQHEERLFEISSSKEEAMVHGRTWKKHAIGTLCQETAITSNNVVDLIDHRRFDQEMKGTQFYADMDALGFNLSTHFNWIETIWHTDTEVLATMRIPNADEHTASPIFPGLMDACFQLMAVPVAAHLHEKLEDSDSLFIPFALDELTIHGRIEEETRCHIQLDQYEDQNFIATVRLCNTKGDLLLKVDGLKLMKITKNQLKAAIDPIADWQYQVQWQPAGIDFSTQKAQQEGAWLIVGDTKGLAKALGDVLDTHQERYDIVSFDDPTATYYLDDPTEASYEQLIQQLDAAGVWKGMIQLKSCDYDTLEGDINEALAQQYHSSITILQHWVKYSNTAVPPVWMVSSMAQAVHEEDTLHLLQSPIWGMARVLATELPEAWGGSIDVDVKDTIATQATSIYQAITGDHTESQLAFRAGECYIPRLRRTTLTKEAPNIQKESTYVITGGLGALGLQVAHGLSEQGVGTLLLVGRRGTVTPEAQVQIDRLEAQGTTVVIVACDITDAQHVRTLFADAKTTLPPVRGIVHAAGVLDDAMLLHTNWDKTAAVLAPKVLGGYHLHEASKQLELDHFVLFSSVASLFGSLGQGAYAAGNMFLDVLAQYRVQQGLPATAINWGPWAAVGMAAHSSDKKRMATYGLSPLAPDTATTACMQMLASTSSNVALLDINWSTFKKALGHQMQYPLFEAVLPKTVPQQKRSTSDTWEQLHHLSPSDLAAEVLTLVTGRIAAILEIDPTAIVPEQSISTLGLDSLLSIELKTDLETKLGITIPVTELIQGPTLHEFVASIVDKVQANQEESTAVTAIDKEAEAIDMINVADLAEDVSAEDAAQLLDQLAELTEEELDQLLSES